MCLATIARRTRNRYLEKNKYTYLEDEIDMLDENIFVAPENVEEEIELKYGVRIDIWTHLTRECIINYVH